MQKIRILIVMLSILVFSSGCSHLNTNDELYKKAIVKLIKDDAKKIDVNKNVIEYAKDNQ